MRLGRVVTAIEVALSSLLLAAGLAVSGIAAVREQFLGVFIGFILFVSGYRLSQLAVAAEPVGARSFLEDVLDAAHAIRLFMVVVGGGAMTYGFVHLVGSMQTTDFPRAVAATGLIFIGYATAHYAVNRTVV